jgi:hypothetical protein
MRQIVRSTQLAAVAVIAFACSVRLMSALGQKRTLDRRPLTSALPPKADIAERNRHVRFVP